MDGWTYDRQTDRHTDVQRENIIPRHYCVAGYKKTVLNIMYNMLQKQDSIEHYAQYVKETQANSMGNLCPPPNFYLRC